MLPRLLARFSAFTFALWLLLVVGAPELVHPCAAHPGGVMESTGGSEHHHTQSDNGERESGGAHCSCAGDCNVSGCASLMPAPGAADLRSVASPSLLRPHDGLTFRRAGAPYAIPWAHAPPASRHPG